MKKQTGLNRRDFMKFLLGSSALGATGQLGLMTQAQAFAPTFNDYKALVCVFLKGGNDSFNMLIPMGNDVSNSHATYSDIRGNLAVKPNALNPDTLNAYNIDGNGLERNYLSGFYSLADQGIDLGVNGVMPELAQLIRSNRASIVGNVGTLIRPVTRDEIRAQQAELPVFLFAHNHQQRILQTGQADNLGDIGWAGKIADSWLGINDYSPLGMNISYSGNDRMLVGNHTSPLIIRPGTPPRLRGLVDGSTAQDSDRVALFKAMQGRESSSSRTDLMFDSSMANLSNDPFRRLYADMQNKSFKTFEKLYQTWQSNPVSYQATGPYGEPLFAVPSAEQIGFTVTIKDHLVRQLEAVAKMIHLSASGAFGEQFNRQIFMVELNGFDTHAAQQTKHPLLLRHLSLALGKFQTALEELGHTDKVMTFTMSDFGRSMSNNGDGTDHAWGGHGLVMGGDGSLNSGSFNGGQLFGNLPDIRLGGVDDHNQKGRIIPTTSQDQVTATLCRWFGVDENRLASIFPHLQNFDSPYINELFVS